jgi:hypothetical protein
MVQTDDVWGDAQVGRDRWRGTVRLDDRQTGPTINDVVGLPHDKWLIIGIDISGKERGDHLQVIAIALEGVPDGSDVLPTIAAANNGEIPATKFLIHHVNPYDVLRAITHDLSFRLRLRGTRDIPIRITELGDVPREDDAD